MKGKHFFFILCLAVFFLFYPGDGYYVRFFSFNRRLFAQQEWKIDHKVNAIPYLVDGSFYPAISAQGAYVVDLLSFTPIFDKNPRTHFLPASTAKIVTALVAADLYTPETVLTVQRVVDQGQIMGLIEGEKMTFENLLYGLLVHSGNDAAYVLADNHPRGYEAFVAAVNHKVRGLGMKDSVFQNPAGLDEFGQHTSPYDLAIASRALLTNKELAKIVSIKSITVSDVDFMYFHKLDNINKLLGEIPGIGGLKTGYTEDAGENLVTMYRKNGHTFLIVILKSEDRFEDTRQIVDWLESNVDYINYQ